jgi:hypothetical protein
MGTLPLRNRLPAASIGATRLRDFATAMARRDRSRHREWLSDADLERAIRGYAYAAAIAEHLIFDVADQDVARAIATYRRVRRFPKWLDPVSVALPL